MLTGNKIHNFNIDFKDPFRSPLLSPYFSFCFHIESAVSPQYNKNKHKQP